MPTKPRRSHIRSRLRLFLKSCRLMRTSGNRLRYCRSLTIQTASLLISCRALITGPVYIIYELWRLVKSPVYGIISLARLKLLYTIGRSKKTTTNCAKTYTQVLDTDQIVYVKASVKDQFNQRKSIA